MGRPPQVFRGAWVLARVKLPGPLRGDHRQDVVRRDAETRNSGFLLLVRYTGEIGCHLFHCDSGDTLLTDTLYDSKEQAVVAAELAFPGVTFADS